jgi:tryptophanyl-tRNA synthetase
MKGGKKPIILSGMRPTGKMHLGHLFGALQNWVTLQKDYRCFYMIADWHALMSEYESPQAIKEYVREQVADWLAVGIDPAQTTIFVQSQVPAHLELFMILATLCPLSWLERCPTYKEQLRELREKNLATYGFLGYPLLQAADILIYQANFVPVGEDQLPHLELTREIARRFNSMYKKEVLVEPKALLTPVPRLLGLDNRKMSKSYGNVINLSDSEQDIARKVSAMVTDPARVKKDDPGHPDVCNVFSYYGIFDKTQCAQLRDDCTSGKIGCVEDKKRLAEAIAAYLKPIRTKRQEIMKDASYVTDVIRRGCENAREETSRVLKEIKAVLHF